ncbi:IS66 family insertion sequence element accessory protein TnpB [Advenella sp. RU8]|jgi:transposase|uniref:IS66 family insertion sequence element accessory protein TnpB n=1 Tax=Advenella TaxID=290425 RepID=UPI002675F1C3|nr:IS66 family insertion sequence element accessory protein TnpB [Advenella alkanexedens]WKU19454.1 IS66 family insertion sequence element accessory protein TnpB [Advenella alkanexedens]
MIRIDQVWLAVEPIDMRAGMDTLLARVVQVFGRAQPHQAYLFSNKRGTRLKVLVHDGLGIWLAVRRLHQGRFNWAPSGATQCSLNAEQVQALLMGLPWQRLGADAAITLL